MANIVVTVAEVRGDVRKFIEKYIVDGKFEFKHVIPVNKDMFLSQDIDLHAKENEWRKSNWGCISEAIDQELYFDEERIILRFETLSRHPFELFDHISRNNDNLRIDIKIANEDIGHYCGYYGYENGNIIYERYYNDGISPPIFWFEFAGDLYHGKDWEDVKKEVYD